MFKWGIRNRLIVSLLVLIIPSLFILGSYVLWYFYHHNLESLKANLLIQAQITEELTHQYMTGATAKGNLDTMIKEMGAKVNNLRITIIDIDGTVLADSNENPALMENHSYRTEIIDALSGKNGNAVRYSTTLGENMLYVAIPIRQQAEITGVVRAATSLSYVEAGFAKIFWALFAAFCLTSLFAIMLSIRIAKNYTAPLEKITSCAQLIAGGSLDARVHVKTGDELEILAHTLNNLTSNLEDKVNEITSEKRKLELILEHMDNAVILLDRYGRLLTANKLAIETFGITPQMFGQHNIQVLGDSQFNLAAQETITTLENRFIDLKTTINHDKRFFQVFLSPITAYEGLITGTLGVFHDITVLQEIHDKQVEFVANASHELGTPLTTIKGFAETLLDGAITDPELSVKFISVIHTEAERMQRLVKDLLQMAKLNSGEAMRSATLEPVEVGNIMQNSVQELAPKYKAKHLQVELQCKESVVILADHDAMKQIIVNLLDNSIKYTPDNGEIIISCYKQDQKAILQFKDTGIGIPAKDLPLIFDRFYRVDRARTRTAGGTGLGLSIVKKLVTTLKGTIEVQSEVDIGTTFTITLPLLLPAVQEKQ